MNSSEERRAAERAQRRRNERLDEKAEREREEERRQQAAREEAAVRAAEDREREKRAELRARLRRERTAAARAAQAQLERERLARTERARDRAGAERQAEAQRAAGEERRRQRAAEDEAAARGEEARREREEERRARAREEELAAERAAELRAAGAERRAEERRTSEAEAERREKQLAERRQELLDERRRLEREAEARAERLRAAREAKLRELMQQRVATEAERERAAERRAVEARRREAERKAQEEQAARRRERQAEEGSARRAEREAEPEELPWLRTEDGEIVEWGGEPRLLRGVNVVGLEEAAAGEDPLREALALDDRNLEELTERWGANLVRLPFGAGTFLRAPPTLEQLDGLVEALSGAVLYTLLALEPPEGLPDQGTHEVWTLLADRYQNQPGVLFEPYAATEPLGEGWPEAALELVHTIRSVHQSSLLVLPMGGDPLVVPNIVYSLRDTRDWRPQLDERFAAFARRNPVLVSEWTNEGPDFGRSAIANADLFERLQIGWCAGNWNAPPRLVADARTHRFAETRFGLIVRRALAAPVRPALTPY